MSRLLNSMEAKCFCATRTHLPKLIFQTVKNKHTRLWRCIGWIHSQELFSTIYMFQYICNGFEFSFIEFGKDFSAFTVEHNAAKKSFIHIKVNILLILTDC